MSNSLKALVFGERGELFAQVAHQKWETMRESLRSLTKNEQMSKLLVILSESLIRSFFRQKCAIRSENRWAYSQPCFLKSVKPSQAIVYNTKV